MPWLATTPNSWANPTLRDRGSKLLPDGKLD
jgi:hypothetical protein